MEFAEFILAHEGDDLGALALARDRYAGEVEDFDLALTTLEVRRKLRSKVPEWYAVPSLRFPLRLSGEQCSSSETARYKASVAAMAGVAPTGTVALRPLPSTSSTGPSLSRDRGWSRVPVGEPLAIADLTGGLGVDSWAFSQVATAVLYNEMRPELADAARANFAALGVKNVLVTCHELRPGNVAEVLDGFKPDLIFLDPARRASDGRKVFRLEDCQPDVLQLLPELLSACPRLLLKLSPMADITLVCRQLVSVKEVHVVAAEGECKELLLLLERGYDGPYSTTLIESGSVLTLPEGWTDIPKSVATLGNVRGRGPKPVLGEHGAWEGSRSDDLGMSVQPFGTILFEPGKALLKAGAFELPCRYGLEILGKHTHLYVGEDVPEALRPFGKVFRVQEAVPMNNRSIKDIGRRYPSASVTARNIPLTSDQLRKKLGVSDGGSVHIFGVHIDAANAHFLLVCTLV